MSAVAMPFVSRPHGPSSPTTSVESKRTSSFTRATALFSGGRKSTRGSQRDSLVSTLTAGPEQPATATVNLKEAGVSITVIENGRQVSELSPSHTPEGSEKIPETSMNTVTTEDNVSQNAIPRKASNGSTMGRDSGKDLGISDEEQRKSPEDQPARPNINTATRTTPPPGPVPPRIDPRRYPPRSGIGPAERAGSLQPDRRRYSNPPPSQPSRDDARRASVSDRAYLTDGRQENRPPPSPGPSRRNSQIRNSVMSLSLPMPAPSPGSYAVQVKPTHKACPGYHRRTIRSANVHHRIMCMVCYNDSPTERWMCSYCALRFCTRCKKEFSTGKSYDQVVRRAEAEGWRHKVPSPNPQRLAQSGSWDTAGKLEGAAARLPSAADAQRRPLMPPRANEHSMNFSIPNPSQPNRLSSQTELFTTQNRPQVSESRNLANRTAPSMNGTQKPVNSDAVVMPSTATATGAKPTDAALMPPPPPPSSTSTTVPSSVLPHLSPTSSKTTDVSVHSQPKRTLLGRMFGGGTLKKKPSKSSVRESNRLKKGSVKTLFASNETRT